MLCSQQFSDSSTDVSRRHQVLTDQHCPHAGVLQTLGILMAMDTAFADDQRVIRDVSAERNGMLQVGMEGPQVSIVDPN